VGASLARRHKVLGRYDSKEEAEKRERQVSRFSESLSADSLEGRAELVRSEWMKQQPAYDRPGYISDVFDDAIVIEKDMMFRRVP